jgi:hypothetical protein
MVKNELEEIQEIDENIQEKELALQMDLSERENFNMSPIATTENYKFIQTARPTGGVFGTITSSVSSGENPQNFHSLHWIANEVRTQVP